MGRETDIHARVDHRSELSSTPSRRWKARSVLRVETADDRSFCESLFVDLQRPVLDLAGWDDTQCAAYLKLQFAQRERDVHMRYPDADYSIVRFDGDDVGRLVVDRGATGIRLLEIVIQNEFRGRGIARDCLRRLCAEADAGSLDIELLVAIDNPAVQLYLDFDFAVVDDDGMYFKMSRPAMQPTSETEREVIT